MSCLCTYDGALPYSPVHHVPCSDLPPSRRSLLCHRAEMNGPFKKNAGVPPPRRSAAVEHKPSSKRAHEDDEDDEDQRGSRRLEYVERENGALNGQFMMLSLLLTSGPTHIPPAKLKAQLDALNRRLAQGSPPPREAYSRDDLTSLASQSSDQPYLGALTLSRTRTCRYEHRQADQRPSLTSVASNAWIVLRRTRSPNTALPASSACSPAPFGLVVSGAAPAASVLFGPHAPADASLAAPSPAAAATPTTRLAPPLPVRKSATAAAVSSSAHTVAA